MEVCHSGESNIHYSSHEREWIGSGQGTRELVLLARLLDWSLDTKTTITFHVPWNNMAILLTVLKLP